VSYHLEYSDEAKRALRTAPGYYRQIFKRTIEGLTLNPWPATAEPMREPGYFKVKFGNWRLIYHVRAADNAVHILRKTIKTGPETYQGLAAAADASDEPATTRSEEGTTDVADDAAHRG